MKHGGITAIAFTFLAPVVLPLTSRCEAQISATQPAAEATTDQRPALSNLLPPAVAQGLDVNAWGWLSELYSTGEGNESYWDLDLALGATQRFGDRVAVTADVHFIDANNYRHGWLEQAFISAKLSDVGQTVLTVGKFNAFIGVEPRNAWDRFGGTTSLLFGAEPQDLLGVMLTQPLGDTGVLLRPFIVNGFEGRAEFNESPSAGVKIEYQPCHELRFAMTNWVGHGFVPKKESQSVVPASYGYIPTTQQRYAYSGYEYDFGNWVGPSLEAERGGTLYFLDGTITWLPRPDLTLAAEGLFATGGSSAGRIAWGGALLLANFDITDRWRAFGRWSFLDDVDGLVTGVNGTRHELSGGVGFEVIRGLELRAEYRHDFSNVTTGLDSVSAHLTFGY